VLGDNDVIILELAGDLVSDSRITLMRPAVPRVRTRFAGDARGLARSQSAGCSHSRPTRSLRRYVMRGSRVAAGADLYASRQVDSAADGRDGRLKAFVARDRRIGNCRAAVVGALLPGVWSIVGTPPRAGVTPVAFGFLIVVFRSSRGLLGGRRREGLTFRTGSPVADRLPPSRGQRAADPRCSEPDLDTQPLASISRPGTAYETIPVRHHRARHE